MELLELLEERVKLLLGEMHRLQDEDKKLRAENESLLAELKMAQEAIDCGQQAQRELAALKKSSEETALRLQAIADRIQGSLHSV